MGSGKSTVASLLARRTGRPFVDNDVQLSGVAGHTAREVQDQRGPDALHALEHRALAEALDGTVPSVIAAAASVIDDPALRDRLRSEAVTIWLKADVDVLVRRVTAQPHRPLGQDPETLLRTQAEARSPLFAEVAAVVVDADRPPPEIADLVLAALAEG